MSQNCVGVAGAPRSGMSASGLCTTDAVRRTCFNSDVAPAVVRLWNQVLALESLLDMEAFQNVAETETRHAAHGVLVRVWDACVRRCIY